MAAVVLMALTLPSFGHVLDLIGGSTVALTSVIFPCLFYLFLAAEEQPVSFFEMINLTDKIFSLCQIKMFVVIGSIAGFVATVYAIKALWLTHFVPPCYLKHMFNSTVNSTTSVSVTNCCGPFQNITRLGMPTEFCAASDLKFY
uniref:Amino acid transporter transmembrane domain-containing protein n=1 Tax=Ditylenchus dipsaci TaxID=166011 RepID=A0A915DXA8_9BILA